MKFSPRLLTLALIALPALQAIQANELPLFIGDEIVVTPTRAPQKLSETLAATAIITRQDIDASGAIDLPTLLQSQVGVEVSQNGGFGTQSAIRLRGAESDHTLVLVDGLRVNSVSTGTPAIEHLALDDIERIEIVRGNVSSVYGSEAIGGVVRIMTHQGHGEIKPRVTVAADTGSYRNVYAGIGGEIAKDMQFDLSAGYLRDGGFSTVRKQYIPTPFVFTAADTDKDETRNTHFNLHLSYQISDAIKWGLSARQNRADIEYDGSFSNHAKQNLAGYSLFAEVKLPNHWTSRLTLGRSTDELDNDLNGTPAGRYHTRIDQLHLENTLTLGGRTFRFGLETQDQQLKSDQSYSRTDRQAVSIYAGMGVKQGAHAVDLSMRHDHYSDFGRHTTGRVAYGYSFAPGLKAHVALSNAFKAPTFNELYTPPAWGGNPNLKPERGRNAELGLSYAENGQFVQATLFVSCMDDLIAYVWPRNVNIDQARNHGLELSWNGKLAGLSTRATFTVQNPENAKTGQALLRRAQRFGSFALAGSRGKFSWQAELIASGSHPDVHVTNFTRTRVPGYVNLNLSGHYALAKNWKLTGRLLNALDADYSQVHGYAKPGREFRLELALIPK